MVTTDAVKNVLAGVLHLSGGAAAVDASWNGVIAQALAQANADLVGILASMGLDRARMALWGDFDTCLLSQAAYRALSMGATLLPAPINSRELASLDQRDKLPGMTLLDNAGNVIVASPAGRLVGHGNIAGGHADLQSRSRRHPRGAFIGADGRFMRW